MRWGPAVAGVASRLHAYEGEAHAFGPLWGRSMRRTVGLLRDHGV